MEKTLKPVPDVEALRYKGTPEKPDIKIFVSHRIDLDSETIDNPLYIPVRCGAVYDERENVSMLGDDTGENISEDRKAYSELTVQYWAWKNIDADYYGLCHYRRYLSFSDKEYSGAWQEQGYMDNMTTAAFDECGLLDEQRMRGIIEKYDMVVPRQFKVSEVPLANGMGYKNVRSYYCDGWGEYLLIHDSIQILEEVVSEIYPTYYSDLEEYLKGKWFRGFNCFVLRKELFYEMCQFEFTIASEINRRLDYSKCSEFRNRTVGYLIEILFSVWIYHQQKSKKYRIKETQLIFFQNPKKNSVLKPAFEINNIPIIISRASISMPELSVVLQSLVDHANNHNNYDIVVLNQELELDKTESKKIQEDKEKLRKILKLKGDNFSLRFFNPCEQLKCLDVREYNDIDRKYKYYIPLLPWIASQYDKVVFLNGCLVINKDISELYYSLDNSYGYWGTRDILYDGCRCGFSDGSRADDAMTLEKMISVSVLVCNLKKIRQEYTQESIVSKCSQMKENEESVLFNQIYHCDIGEMPASWNYIVISNSNIQRCFDYAPMIETNKYKQSIPYVYNMSIFPRTWSVPTSPFSYVFWEYARKTPFYEELICSLLNLYTMINPKLQIEQKTNARKAIDFFFPQGSNRRKLAKKIVPRNSWRWKFCKQVYYVLEPKYRKKQVTRRH